MLIRVTIPQENADALEEMCDERTLRLWARTGKLTPESTIWDGNRWVVAKEYHAVRDIFTTSIWDVWEESLDVHLSSTKPISIPKDTSSNISTPSNSTTKPPPPMLPLSAIFPLEEEEPRRTRPVRPRTSSLQSTTADPPPSVSTNTSAISDYTGEQSRPSHRTTTSPSGSSHTEPSKNSMDYSTPAIPSTPATPSTLAALWNPEKDLREQPQLWLHTNPPKTRSSISFLRVSFIVIPGFMVLLGIRSYIIAEATTQFPEEDIATVTNITNPSVQEQFWATEKSLRSQLREDIQKVSPENSLDDALRIELSYMKMDIVRIDASVLGWRGRLLDEPKGAKIKIVINSSGDIEDELALIAMMVAKYTERYTLDMKSFVVVLQMGNGKALSKEIPTDAARTLLLQPGSLPQFFQSITSQ